MEITGIYKESFMKDSFAYIWLCRNEKYFNNYKK